MFASYPELFADFHALLRLLMPRHPPCALSNLTIGISNSSRRRTKPSFHRSITDATSRLCRLDISHLIALVHFRSAFFRTRSVKLPFHCEPTPRTLASLRALAQDAIYQCNHFVKDQFFASTAKWRFQTSPSLFRSRRFESMAQLNFLERSNSLDDCGPVREGESSRISRTLQALFAIFLAKNFGAAFSLVFSRHSFQDLQFSTSGGGRT